MSMQDELKTMGFCNVLGMTEHAGGNAKELTISKGTPRTWDYNNGVTVVYDNNGDPWLHRGSVRISDNFTRGAYVPMSNDGGWSIRNLFPTLQEKREHILSSYYTAEKFLKRLNATELIPIPFKFAKNVDTVIVGTCADGHPCGHNSTTGITRHDPNPSFFERFPDFKDAKVILLIAECCSGYSDAFVEKLNVMYPHVEEWIIPVGRDYCNHPSAEQVFKDLKYLGIIIPAKA